MSYNAEQFYEEIFKKSAIFLIWGNLVVFCDVVYDFVFSVFPLFLTRQEPSDTQLHLWFVVCMLSVFVFISKDISRDADVFVYLARMTHGSKSPSLVIV